MEEYLQNLKSLRYQMNDVEEEAAKRSVDEQKQKTAIDAMEKDLLLLRSESKRLNEEAEEMAKEKARVCCEIAEKQRKISAMEVELSTLSQTLELLQQEMVGASVKLKEKRSYYAKTMEELCVKLRNQQDWFESHKQKLMEDNQSVKERPRPVKQLHYTEGDPVEVFSMGANLENMGDKPNGRCTHLVTQLESAKANVEDLRTKKSEIALESSKLKQLMEQLTQKTDGVPTALKAMDVKALEEEHKALLTDKAGETEYLQSLHDQIKQLKDISHVVKCQCGEEYKVELIV